VTGNDTSAAAAREVMARIETLAHVSDEPHALTRLYLSPAHREAVGLVRGWMEEAGMSAAVDDAATVVGRYEAASGPGAPALLLGSHIDTVRDAGKYDGNLGVVAAIAAVDGLRREGLRLPFAIEVLAFGDEEGARFPVTLTGSRAVAGTFDPRSLEAVDPDDVTLADALRAFGCDPARLGLATRRPGETLGYVELQIEQGPVLEAEGLPVGVVTAINGASRFAVRVGGMAGHAGTVPMRLRRDALAAAAEMIVALDERARSVPDLVATVGIIDNRPGVPNVISAEASFTIDIRHPDDAVRLDAIQGVDDELHAIADRRFVRVASRQTYDAPAASCAPALVDRLEVAVARAGVRPFRLPSGAGHDGLAVQALCPIGMLFVRCRGGISHNPAESVTEADVGVALAVLGDFLRSLDPSSLARTMNDQ
jgi:allantoate deiminase